MCDFLIAQLPLGNGDGDISPDEFYEYYPGSLPSPENLHIIVVENEYVLNWSSVPGANSYKIFQSDLPYDDFREIDTTMNTTYIIPAAGDSKLFFRVTAIR